MKKYIILTNSIRNMGGGQMYVANKLKYFRILGWETSVFFYNDGEIFIPDLKKYSLNLVRFLRYDICSCSNSEKKKVASFILGDVNINDEIIIESNQLHLSMWGEYLAALCKGKHLVYLLDENFRRISYKESLFFDFKIRRNELMNSEINTLKSLFKSFYKEKYAEGLTTIEAYCSNVVDYTPITIPEFISDADFNLLSVGRLDKPYIKPMLEGLKNFCNEHCELKFNIIFVGSDANNIMPNYINNFFCNIRENYRHIQEKVNLFINIFKRFLIVTNFCPASF